MARTVLVDGFKTLINFGGTFIEWKEIQPPGMIGGGGIDTTTHFNENWRTAHPKALKTLSESGGTVAYDASQLAAIMAQVNVLQEFIITFPDDSTTTFWGWLDEFVPDPLVEGEQPTANAKIIPSNQNDTLDETAPAFA